MHPLIQPSAPDHTGAQTKLYPWDLILTLEWGGEQGFTEQDWIPSPAWVPAHSRGLQVEDSVGSCGPVMAPFRLPPGHPAGQRAQLKASIPSTTMSVG